MVAKNNSEKYYGNNRASKVIYGAILLFVFIAGMAHSGDTQALPMALKTFVAAITIVFAEIYAEFIGERIKQKGKLDDAERRDIARDAFAIASVSIWPCIIFLVSGTNLYGVEMAFKLAEAFCLAVLLVFSYWAFRMSGMSKVRAAIVASVTLAVGAVVIFLKYAAWH